MKKLISCALLVITFGAPLTALSDDPSPSPAATPYYVQHISKCPETDDAVDSFNRVADYAENNAHATPAALALSNIALRLSDCAKRELSDPRYAIESDEEESSLALSAALANLRFAMAIAYKYNNCILRNDLYKEFQPLADFLSTMQLSDSVAARLGEARDSVEDLRAKPCVQKF